LQQEKFMHILIPVFFNAIHDGFHENILATDHIPAK